jgi:arylsulfatase A-like enzyme
MDRPFYLHMVLTDSHKPIRIPPAEAERWTDAGSPNGPYMGTVKRADDALGQLVNWLGKEGLAEDTYVVFISDHGEGLNRPTHQGPAHGRYLGHAAAQVPWIVSGPDIPTNHQVLGLASTVDVAPTLLGLLGAGDLGEVSGKDWSAPLKGQGRATDRDVAWTDTWYHNANRAAVWTADMQCQRDFGSLNLDDAFVDACYHRDKDPEFLDPITNAGLMERLGQWRADRPVVGKPAAAKTPKGKPPVKQGKAKGKAPAKSGKVKAPVD